MINTIAAVSTAPGVAGIGVVRISGPEALSILDRVFRPYSGHAINDLTNRTAHVGSVLDVNSEVLDECMCVIFRAPYSYTGENLVEFQCHGSPVILGEVLRSVYASGARPAAPGEFTKRAFLSGRLDLAQAEAVIDIIEADTILAAKAAASQLGGSISRIIERGYGDLLDISAHFHAVVDYPDEDIEDFRAGEYAFKLNRLKEALTGLLETFERGYVLKNGFLTAIIGRPNVGKSSLLNALLGYDRAIVTENPGTTRDTIEEKLVLGDTLLRIVDTAGLRHTEDEAESEGVTRALRAAEEAELVIAVFDGSSELTEEDRDVIRAASGAKRSIAVINKSDLPQTLEKDALGHMFETIVDVSAKQSEGLGELSKAVAELVPKLSSAGAGGILTNTRQAEGVSRAIEYVKEASIAMNRGVTPDAVLTEIEGALEALGEVLGRNIREDTIDRIFSRFCVGK